MNTPDPLIDVTGLAKRYDRRVVIDQVSMRVMPGDLLGLVGANGGGKTTTLRMLAGLIAPDAGAGQVLGHDLGRPHPDTRAKIGYMAQRLALYPDLSVAENLWFRANVFGLSDRGARIHDVAHTYGVTSVMAQRFGTLSGGWARRVQFAATMLPAPPLLLLDEPTAGLDVATKRDIWSWLGALASDGHAIVISTHDLAEAERCPSIIFYHDGHARGPMRPAQLIAETRTATLEDAVADMAKDSA
jgi:ABC-2 type transport system ATP-binding protein